MYADQDAINTLKKLNQEQNNSNENTTQKMDTSKNEPNTEVTSSSSSSYESDDTTDSGHDIATIHVTRVYRSRKAIQNEDFTYYYIDDESKGNDGHFRLLVDDVESDCLTGI